MAKADGRITIETQIKTKNAEVQLSSLENRIIKTADKISALKTKMDALKNSKIPTAEYTEVANQIERANKKFNQLLSKQYAMQVNGQTTGKVWDNLSMKMDEVGNEIHYAEGELQDLVDTGKAFTLGSDTAEYAKMQQQLGYLESEMATLGQRHDLLDLKAKKNTKSYANLSANAKKAMNSLKGFLAKSVKNISKLGSGLKNIATKLFPLFNKQAKKASGTMGKFGVRLKSLISGVFIFNVIRSALNKLFDGIKEGYDTIYKSNSAFKKSVDSLKASASTLKNALASAFLPLVQVAIPYLQQAVSWMTALVDKVAQFIAAITGQKTYLKAVKQTASAIEDEAAAADDANKQLSSLDKLNNLSSSNDGGSSGSSGGAGSAAFEEVPIESKWGDVADWIKDMWADGDFFELGKMLGDKLAEALANIPWDNIKKNARKLGSSLATLINGFIEGEFDGKSVAWWIGHTLAEAINTAFEFLNEFVHKLNWKGIGKFIADQINGFTQSIDWDLIKDTFVTGAHGLGDAINSFADNLDWDSLSHSIAEFVDTVFATIYEFFSTVEWDDLGEHIGELITDTIEDIDFETVGRAIGSVIQSAIDFLQGIVDGLDFSTCAEAIKDVLKGAFEELDFSDVAEVIAIAIAAKLAKVMAGKAFAAMLANLGIGAAAGAAGTAGAGTAAAGGAAAGAGTAAAALAGLTSALATVAAAVGIAEVGFQAGVAGLDDYAEATGKSTRQAEEMQERYSGLGGIVIAFKDILAMFGAEMDGLPFEYTLNSGEALEDMFNEIAEGTIYSNEQLEKAQGLWNLTDEDMEMLRQEMLDANDSLRTLADAFPELNNTSVEALREIYDGFIDLKEAGSDYKSTLDDLSSGNAGLTEEATEFFDSLAKGSPSLDDLNEYFNALYESGTWTKFSTDELTDAVDKFNSASANTSTESLSDMIDGFNNSASDTTHTVQSLADEVDRLNFSNLESEEGTYSVEQFKGAVADTTLTVKELSETMDNLDLSETSANIANGLTEGMSNADTDTPAQSFFDKIVSSIKSIFGIASPAENMKPLGEYMMLGVVEGFNNMIESFNTAISAWFTGSVQPWFTAERWTAMLATIPVVFKSAFTGALNAVKNVVSNMVSWVSSKLSSLSSMISGFIGGIKSVTGRISSVFSGGYSTTTYASLDSMEIPGYATGQVIPRAMKQHLAVLGDNNQETEIVSPLSTMKQAVKEALREGGYGTGGNNNTGDIVVQIDGREVFRATQKKAREYKKMTGSSAFA